MLTVYSVGHDPTAVMLVLMQFALFRMKFFLSLKFFLFSKLFLFPKLFPLQ